MAKCFGGTQTKRGLEPLFHSVIGHSYFNIGHNSVLCHAIESYTNPPSHPPPPGPFFDCSTYVSLSYSSSVMKRTFTSSIHISLLILKKKKKKKCHKPKCMYGEPMDFSILLARCTGVHGCMWPSDGATPGLRGTVALSYIVIAPGKPLKHFI